MVPRLAPDPTLVTELLQPWVGAPYSGQLWFPHRGLTCYPQGRRFRAEGLGVPALLRWGLPEAEAQASSLPLQIRDPQRTGLGFLPPLSDWGFPANMAHVSSFPSDWVSPGPASPIPLSE